MSKVKFYICENCGNIIVKLHDSRVPVSCCGDRMKELVPNVVEASGEKHIPVAEVKDGIVKVNVGAVDHPMVEAHWIEWIYLEFENGGVFHYLNPDEEPSAEFAIGSQKPVAVYAYCNLHGLWKSEIK